MEEHKCIATQNTNLATELLQELQKNSKRWFILFLVTLMLLFTTNIAWIWYINQYETITYEQDGEGINNINSGGQGDVLNESKAKN